MGPAGQDIAWIIHGKSTGQMHFREWCTIIPYVGVVFSIWNGIDSAQGKTTADLAGQYGATYY